jgi:adhesin transport system membrane fusion protein
MLNISNNTISKDVDSSVFKSFEQTGISSANVMFTRWLVGALLVFIAILFLPWTQNVQAEGKVTTLQPGQRPQTIQSTIAGRIENWYVREGDFVEKGDTIVFLSEIKSEYFDPDLVPRTEQQVEAKEGSIAAYGRKANALQDQIRALRVELELKREQLDNKVKQNKFKVTSDSADMIQAFIQDSVALQQYRRASNLFERGIKSRTDVEDKQVKLQSTNAKLISARNKYEGSLNELINARIALNSIQYEYNQKIAKAESDLFSTRSAQFDATGSVNKLKIQAANYERRSSFYYIVAPQNGYIAQAIKPGIGETVKEGEGIVTVMPADYELAVEMYVRPMDLPLIDVGQEVRFIFDGWPAFIFSGWPGQSFGTFTGNVVAIDNMISPNGEYRILVSPDSTKKNAKPWPEALRVGSGAQGIALLNNVQVWYEIWRRLNGFPPDYYDDEGKNEKEPKMKAPAKSIK